MIAIDGNNNEELILQIKGNAMDILATECRKTSRSISSLKSNHFENNNNKNKNNKIDIAH